MDFARKSFDLGYDFFRNSLFYLTKKDPEVAHELFVSFGKAVSRFGLDRLLLDNPTNRYSLKEGVVVSNAAGLNKNGDIPPRFLKYLGFDRVVVGTVTNEAYDGKPRPRMKRYPFTESLVNWMGLPGVGSKRVAENLERYFDYGIPTTVNVMSTPGKRGNEALEDIEGTVNDARQYTDRFELNISCPNTHSKGGELDVREEYQKSLSDMLGVVFSSRIAEQEVYVKVSPDMDRDDVCDILDVVKDFNVSGITGTNTTTEHDPKYINPSLGKGGASGQAVKKFSFFTQELFMDEIEKRRMDLKYISVGGIDSGAEALRRVDLGACELQILTPLIFKGPKLLREIRERLRA